MSMVRFVRPLVALIAWLPSLAAAQEAQGMRLEAATGDIGIEIDGVVLGRWQFNPNNYPRDLPLPVERDAPTTICFIDRANRTCADFIPGQSRPLAIAFNEAEFTTVIRAQRDVPPAQFDAAYQAAYRGRTVVEVPEVYELVNIAIAITPSGQGDPDMVYQDSSYFQAVQSYFAAHADHPLIQRVEAMLRENRSNYFSFKMNGYAFVFDAQGQIVRSPVYDRTGFAGSLENPVLPLLADLQDFARVSGFRDFYREHQALYAQQIAFFEEEAQVSRISSWLTQSFPSVHPYDGVKIIFSPLVAYNQSMTTIEADGYRELQPHVNYPYSANTRLSPAGAAIQRSAILFTEMNHGFSDPTAEQYSDRLSAALANRAAWADDASAAGNYAGAVSLFNEYMNWALVSLYYRDLMNAEDFAVAHAAMVDNMQNGRGFRRFAAFDAELLRLYAAREPGQTLEDLYPAMLDWVEAQ